MTPTPTGHHGDPTYAIRVRGRLGARWSAWFDGLDVTSTEDGTTTIQGAVADQAALHGLLQKVRDVGLPILSVAQVAQDDRGAEPSTPTTTEGH
jgi:hypothetical protein